jgi:Tfp pilus assembly protein PilF
VVPFCFARSDFVHIKMMVSSFVKSRSKKNTTLIHKEYILNTFFRPCNSGTVAFYHVVQQVYSETEGNAMYRILIGLMAVLFLMTAGYPVSAQEMGSAFYDEGVFAYEDGDFKTAEAAFKKALASDPNSPSANHYLGKTYIEMERFKDARPFVDKAWQGDPDMTDLSYDRAFLYYKMADYDTAAGLFQNVVKEEPSRVLANFYCGVSLYRNGQYEAANPYLMTAAEKSPELKAKAYYYSGLCHYYAGQNAQAVDKLTYVKTNSDSKEVRDNAGRWIKSIQTGAKVKKPYMLEIKLAYEYDDNVPLEPSDQDDLYSEEKDALILGYVAGEYNVVNQDTLIVGAGLSRYQTWHVELDEYDISETAFKLYGRYMADPFSYGLKLVPSIYQLDGEDYLLTTKIKPEISYAVNQQTFLWLSYTFSANDYRQSDFDDRDGSSHELFLDAVYTLDDDKGYILGGFGYEDNTASEDVYDYGRLTVRAGGSFDLAFALRFGVMGTYAAKAYKNDDPIEDKKREDARYKLSVSLSRGLYYEWLEIAAEASYSKNDSNIGNYEYTRQIFGIGLSATF